MLVIRHSEIIETRERFVVKKEKWSDEYRNMTREVITAYTPEGHWIGDPKFAQLLTEHLKLQLMLANPTDEVCTIGKHIESNEYAAWKLDRPRVIFLAKIDPKYMMFNPTRIVQGSLWYTYGDHPIETTEQSRESAVAISNYLRTHDETTLVPSANPVFPALTKNKEETFVESKA